MKLETFFEKFDQFADAPDAVAKMRELVLQWAVQGRLVRQDSNEEPASQLIRQAVQARKRLVSVNVIRDESPDLSFLNQNGKELPRGWVHAPLSVYVGVIMGQSPPSTAYNESSDGLPFYQGKAQFGRLYPTATNWCTEPTKIGEPGDVVISVRAPVGPTNILREKSCIGRGLASLRSLGGDQIHLLYTLRAYERSIAAMGVGSTFVAISKSDLDNFRIPIPPLAEQKRIVAKVDELMALCDRLEAQQQERETQHAALARASLARFAAAPTPANINFLFHKSYDITPADLRKCILFLAVQGKLVPQDPNDEPAEDAFAKLTSSAVESEDDYFPSHWLRVPLGKTGEWRGGGTPSKSRPEFWKGDLPWVSPKDMKVLHIVDAQDHISPAAVEGSSVRLIPPGSLLMVVRGMILARAFPVALSMREITINQDMKALLPSEPKTKEFLLVALRAFEPEVLAAIEHSSHGTCKLKTGFLKDFVMPLPPLAEQKRIVAKVDQLMALVDELEAQLAASRAAGEKLLAALVAELTASN